MIKHTRQEAVEYAKKFGVHANAQAVEMAETIVSLYDECDQLRLERDQTAVLAKARYDEGVELRGEVGLLREEAIDFRMIISRLSKGWQAGNGDGMWHYDKHPYPPRSEPMTLGEQTVIKSMMPL